MVGTARRVRLLWQTLACAVLASCLAACGGGGGGSSPTPPSNSGGNPTESTYLLAEFVAADSNHQFVRVWDPAAPTVAVQSVPLVQSNGIIWTSSHLVFSDATRYDATTGTVTTLGHVKVFYDNDGKLYSIDLRGGQSHAPVQVSAVTDAFIPTDVVPLDDSGVDAWIDVQGGSHHWAIRSGMSATDAPVDILKIIAPLRDPATGRPMYFFVSLGGQSGFSVRPTTFEIVDTSFAAQSIPQVAGMAAGDSWVGADPAQPGLAYLRIANQLHELHWAQPVAGVSVDAGSLYTMSIFGQAPAVADAHSLYVNDGVTLLALSNGTVLPVGTFSIAPYSLLDAGSYVAAMEPNGTTTSAVLYQLETLRKTGGAATLLEDATTTLQLLGATDQGLILTGTPEQGQAFVLASGDNTTRTTMGSQYVGVVRAASARLDQPAAPVALLSCVAGTGGFCAAGALTELELAGGSTALGTIAASAPWLRGDATVGVATSLGGQTFLLTTAGLGSNQTSARDAWQFTPAVAGTLMRITSNLP